jgi:LmbE family N-acetylglucosaminyl deacetylase
MMPLQIGPDHQRLRVLCLGAHSDDIELGCAGTLLQWLSRYERMELTWVVFSATGERAVEARKSARALMKRAARLDIVLGDFVDTQFPAEYTRLQAFMRSVAAACTPDVVLTHRLEDRHQDHRLVAELTPQAFRNHLIMEYEIPKYEADLGQPNLYVPLAAAVAERKQRHLLSAFGSQRSKDWFNERGLSALMNLRGLECRAPSGCAEAFHVRKAVI